MNDRRGTTARRVLFVNHAGAISGAELSLLELLGRLDPGRVLPLVACPEGPLATHTRRLGIRHVPVRLRRIRRTRALTDLLLDVMDVAVCTASLTGIIREHRIHLVHANSTTACLYAAWAAKLTGVPAVWHVRDLVELGALGRLLYRLADAVACVSEAVEEHTARCGGDRDKLWTVTNGIDVEAFRKSAIPGSVRAEFGITPGTCVVTQVAQLTPWKGHVFLLEAIRRVKEAFPQLRVLLVGKAMSPQDAKHAAGLRSLVERLGLAETVTFTGWRDDVASIVADSDVVVMPSENEPFGRAAVEAMALGKPVVAADAGGLPEIIDDRRTGLLVRYADVEGLTRVLLQLLRSPVMRQYLGENARAEVERFDVSRTAGQVQNLYDDLLGEVPRTAGVCA